jgi:hypothetical protein
VSTTHATNPRCQLAGRPSTHSNSALTQRGSSPSSSVTSAPSAAAADDGFGLPDGCCCSFAHCRCCCCVGELHSGLPPALGASRPSRGPTMVWVLPLPVWPKAKMVALYLWGWMDGMDGRIHNEVQLSFSCTMLGDSKGQLPSAYNPATRPPSPVHRRLHQLLHAARLKQVGLRRRAGEARAKLVRARVGATFARRHRGGGS